MIPAAPLRDDGRMPDTRRILFRLDGWEIVLYKNYELPYAVHVCREPMDHYKPASRGNMIPVVPRAIIRRGELRVPGAQCWNCDVPVPDEIITVWEMLNA